MTARQLQKLTAARDAFLAAPTLKTARAVSRTFEAYYPSLYHIGETDEEFQAREAEFEEFFAVKDEADEFQWDREI